MTLALTADHRELAEQLRAWAESLDGPAHVRAAEGDAGATFDDVWARVADQQVATIGLSEAAGGGGGSLLDAAVALESAARAMVPGSLLGTTFAALVADQASEPHTFAMTFSAKRSRCWTFFSSGSVSWPFT